MISQKTHVRYSATAGFRKKNLSRCFFARATVSRTNTSLQNVRFTEELREAC